MTAKPPLILGLEMPDVDVWSERVVVGLGQNPSQFTGPGTNTYLIGTGEERILLDTGSGHPEYIPVLERALEQAGCRAIQEIVLTHGHPDHIGGVASIQAHFGKLKVSKLPDPLFDPPFDLDISAIGDDARLETEGAHLRALHTPGHAPDHLCFVLEEERSVFTGDNVLGVGTTVIPSETGDLGAYMNSLARLQGEDPTSLYPAHGPVIRDGRAKLKEYIAHRNEREAEILAAVDGGAHQIAEMVAIIYAAYPVSLHVAAGQSVGSHLLKLEAEGAVVRNGDPEAKPTLVSWKRA